MKTIKILSLALENFKCHANLVLNVNGNNATIYGDNAVGKTSIYDALTWLLFGKDSAGNGEKNINIKPLDAQGNVRDHDAITSVTALLEVDGVPVSLKRSLREVWATKRGSSEATFSGNVSEYFVDGTPMKKGLFDDKVDEIVPENVFRMLTSVTCFSSDLKWQDRRAILFDAAGTADDAAIMAMDAKWAPLSQGMGSKSMSDYHASLTYNKKGLMVQRNEIPARISEVQRTLESAAAIDLGAVSEESYQISQQMEAITGQIAAIDNSAAVIQKRTDLREAKMDLENVQRENGAFRAAQDDGSGLIREIESKIRAESITRDAATKASFSAETRVAHWTEMQQRMREKWVAENAKTFTGGVCPTCGRELPFDQLQQHMDEFNKQKQAALDDIAKQGNDIGASIKQAQDEKNQADAEAKAAEQRIEELKAQLAQAKAAATAKVDMDGYAERVQACEQRINQLNAELAQLANGAKQQREALAAQKADLSARYAALQGLIAQAGNRSRLEDRIKELREDQQNASAQLEAIEQQLYLMEEFVRYKAGFVEDSINSLFTIAKFQLFREQANGGLEERCDVTYDGVPYTGLNNGMKINVGIDIINTLSRHYGVCVPLFVDNAEAVTHLLPCAAQTIRLVVSETDKELRVNED